jgi:methylenetetrahydrofolate dehydrogenase (NADP+) / methenyltetrahydrofolate cyclohydrolase
MQLIDGKKMSAEIRLALATRVKELVQEGVTPGLATILVGEDPASEVYVANKIKACEALGIKSFHYKLPATATKNDITGLIAKLNANYAVNGILLQLPLPRGLDADKILEDILPEKDVDGLHPYNIGMLSSAKTWAGLLQKKVLMSCTPYGSILLLQKYGVEMPGKNAVVVGRSNLAGKPVALMLLANNATVTIAHSKTKNLAEICRNADILVAAIGIPKMIKKDFIKPGAAVIDIGINRTAEGLCGDVDFDAAKDVAGLITPVPGGVGAMTITMLMKNTITACEKQNNIK